METSATADGFYFSVRSTRPVLLRRVCVRLRDGTAPTTVRVAVRRGGAAKRPQAARTVVGAVPSRSRTHTRRSRTGRVERTEK